MVSENTASLWSHIATERAEGRTLHGWLDAPLVQYGYVQPLTGLHFTSGEQNWLATLVSHHQIPSDARWLSLGCGNGGWELFAAASGLVGDIEGIDVATDAIRIAQQAAEERGIRNAHFRVANANNQRLAEGAYDVILCSMALHHIERLEFFLAEVANALRPGGWLILNEFIGPSRWQWSDAQLTVINTLLQALPSRYRIHAITGAIKAQEERPSIEFMKHLDPSESVRSAEIAPLVGSSFEIIDRRDYGGAILHKLLEYIVGNFDPQRSEDVDLLHLLFSCEQALMRTGMLGSDFAIIVAQNTRSGIRGSSLPLDGDREKYIASGCYAVETPIRGKTFFWTAADAEIVLQRPPQARYLHLHVLLPPSPGCLTISVDNQPIGCLQLRQQESPSRWRHVAFGLPATSRAQPSIHLHCDAPWSPTVYGYPDDTRQLGVGIRAMWYGP